MVAEDWWWGEGMADLKKGAERFGELADDWSPNEFGDTLFISDVESILQDSVHPEMLGKLDEYEIEKLIGVGGMGVVFKGFDHDLNRAVAIKALLPRLANFGQARKRFAREAQAAAAIVHQNVVPIFRIQSNSKLPYIVMPFVSGNSLQTYVERHGSPDILNVVRIAMQVADGLAAAHEQGLVHRDVKPANILLEDDCNRVLLTDFGLARAADDASLTRTGLIAGTPHYMSPEQSRGEAIDARSDLFSMGCVLYFLLSGRPPFRAEHAMGVMHKICQFPALDIRELNPATPNQLAFAVHRLLEKSPDRRLSSSCEVYEFMKSLLAHLQSPISNRSPAIKPPKSIRKNSNFPWMLASSALLLLVLISLGAVLWNDAMGAKDPIERQSPKLSYTDQKADRLAKSNDAAFFDFGSGIELTSEWSEEAARIDAEIVRLNEEEILTIPTTQLPGENE